MAGNTGNSIIGIDLGGTKVAAARISNGHLETEAQERIDTGSKDPMDVVLLLSGLIKSQLDGKVKGIGIGVPGLVDRAKGIAYDVLNIPSWKEVPLRSILEREFNLPVYLDNDSNCFAIGEYKYGAYAGHPDFVGITLGTGMGAGIIKNGALMPDANCCSGEFGNIPYLDGIYEHYCSGMFFSRTFGKPGEEVTSAAENGETWAIEAFNQFGTHLGNAVKTIKMAVDPALIILGGSVARAHHLFTGSLWKSVQDFAFPSALKDFQILFSDTPHIALLGAAALVPLTPQTPPDFPNPSDA